MVSSLAMREFLFPLFSKICLSDHVMHTKAVIVCFAEAPDVFQNNYKELCDEMLEAWKKAYPSECSDDFSSIKV